MGTSWECLEEPELIVFSSIDSGIYYIKSAIDGVYDDVYSSFDFNYKVSGNNVKIHLFYSRFDSVYDFEMIDENNMTARRFHYKKIQHRDNLTSSVFYH